MRPQERVQRERLQLRRKREDDQGERGGERYEPCTNREADDRKQRDESDGLQRGVHLARLVVSCGRSSTVEPLPSKQVTRVQLPPPALSPSQTSVPVVGSGDGAARLGWDNPPMAPPDRSDAEPLAAAALAAAA